MVVAKSSDYKVYADVPLSADNMDFCDHQDERYRKVAGYDDPLSCLSCVGAATASIIYK